MKSSSNGQVPLSDLLFTMNWEDPESDLAALRIAPSDAVLTITSGGCNTLGFLLQDPAVVYAVDINPAQTCLLELKMAAMARLEHPDFLGFLGVSKMADRADAFEQLRPDLSPAAERYWSAARSEIAAGILGQGRFERYVSAVRRLLAWLQGRERVEGLFEQSGPEAQQRYFDAVWDTRRFRMIFPLFFNKHLLARRGLSAQYFSFDDGSQSFAESFYRRIRHALRDLPIGGNYFAARYLLGAYRLREVPPYLDPAHYETIRSRLGRVQPVTADVKVWLEGREPAFVDCFSLSNICELMDGADTERTFRAVVRAARPGARLCFRNLMISRTVPGSLDEVIVRDDAASTKLLYSDRSFVYSRVDALRVAIRPDYSE